MPSSGQAGTLWVMPTVLSHAAVPLALGLGLGPSAVPPRLMAAGAIAAALPDLDVVAFRLGVPYAAQFGHRGFSHSLVFAVAVALVGASCHRPLRMGSLAAFAFLFAAAASHGVLDAFTDGGLGVAFLWPFSSSRYFAPFRPITVSPLGAARLLSSRGAAVAVSELLWVWLPAAALGATIAIGRRVRSGSAAVTTR